MKFFQKKNRRVYWQDSAAKYRWRLEPFVLDAVLIRPLQRRLISFFFYPFRPLPKSAPWFSKITLWFIDYLRNHVSSSPLTPLSLNLSSHFISWTIIPPTDVCFTKLFWSFPNPTLQCLKNWILLDYFINPNFHFSSFFLLFNALSKRISFDPPKRIYFGQPLF